MLQLRRHFWYKIGNVLKIRDLVYIRIWDTKMRSCYFKDIACCISEMPFELQPEDGFIRSQNMSLIWSFNYILIMFYKIRVVLDWKLVYILLKKKGKVFPLQARCGQRVGRGIALLLNDGGTRRGWVVSSTPRPHFTPGKEPVPILQEAGWAPGLVWRDRKSRPHRDSIPDHPARSQPLYWLSYPAHVITENTKGMPHLKKKTPIQHMMSKNFLEFFSELEIFWIKWLIDRPSSVLKCLVKNIFSSLHTS